MGPWIIERAGLLHVGTHLVHDSHCPATLFPTSTHYKPIATVLYIGKIDYSVPRFGRSAGGDLSARPRSYRGTGPGERDAAESIIRRRNAAGSPQQTRGLGTLDRGYGQNEEPPRSNRATLTPRAWYVGLRSRFLERPGPTELP